MAARDLRWAHEPHMAPIVDVCAASDVVDLWSPCHFAENTPAHHLRTSQKCGKKGDTKDFSDEFWRFIFEQSWEGFSKALGTSSQVDAHLGCPPEQQDLLEIYWKKIRSNQQKLRIIVLNISTLTVGPNPLFFHMRKRNILKHPSKQDETSPSNLGKPR